MTSTSSLLKEAREAIKNKEYQTCLKLCKTVLKEDKENYMALVFLGISLQEVGPTDQAPKAFRKAIQKDSNNPLAWNGLASYYEKVDCSEAKEQLIEIYVSLLNVCKDEKKQHEICEKLIALPVSSKNQLVVTDALYKRAKCETSGTHYWELLSTYFSKIENLSDELIKIYEDVFNVILNNENVPKHFYTEYFQFLQKQGKYEVLLKESLRLSEEFKDEPLFLEWFCKTYNKLAIENPISAEFTEAAKSICSSLLTIDQGSTMGLFTKAVISYQSNDFIEAKHLLENVTKFRSGLLYAWVLLAKCYLELQLYSDGIEAAKRANKLLQSINDCNVHMKKMTDSLLVQLLSRSDERELWSDGLNICLQILEKDEKDITVITSLIRIFINLENYKEASNYLKQLENKQQKPLVFLQSYILKKQGQLEEALKLLKTSGNIDTSEYWLELAILYWETEKFNECLVPLLKAAKLNPHSYKCFLYLGHHYQKFNDAEKARRCYEKSFRLNSKCQEAGIELSKIYRKLKNWDANLKLLENLTSGKINPNNKWAYLQLGLHYFEHEEYSKAIDSLRFITRSDPENCHYWEALADAYMARGAFTSALKSYQRVIELSENTLYALLQIANIKKLLGQYQEAKLDFEQILSANKRYVPALKGLAETCMNEARHFRRIQLLGRARDYAQEALDHATVGLQQNSEISCLWKIAADSCNLVAQLPQKLSFMIINCALSEGKNVDGNTILEQNELFILAERCYCKALSLIEDNVLLWHDLSACYFAHGQHIEKKENANILFSKAQASVEHCISINPSYWQHWNLLGIIAFNKEPQNFSLAQHAFIKAVSIEHNSAVAWCNLGTLYIHIGDIKLANKAYSQAQRADPNYVNSWVGQALIAEFSGHEDTMDLFRHSTQLNHIQESALGYGYWVCKTILKNPVDAIIYAIHNMHAVPVALDSLTWYTENNPDDACAWNMLGLLKERMGLKLGSEKAYKVAVTLTDNDSDRDKAYVNYGRALMKLGKCSEAVDILKNVRAATFNSVSALALAFFKDEQYEESYEAYESALHWMTEEQLLQSDLLVALASMAYLFQGTQEAKTLLFQSTQLQPRSPWGLYATLSLGLLHNETKLAMLVLKEFNALKDDMRCLPHIAVLMSYTYLLQHEYDKAVRELSKLVHRHPDQGSLWLTLSDLLLRIQSYKKICPAAARCAHKAMKLGQSKMDVTKVLCMVSLASYANGDYKEALKSAQSAIHTYPNLAESWAVLIATLAAIEKKSSIVLCNVKKYISYAQIHFNPNGALESWLAQFDVQISST